MASHSEEGGGSDYYDDVWRKEGGD